ncbi:MAG: bifunctional (p)ppGpp synthetase/guanosine-3',5'-bis(diphosphate) 3'-pyrophosphohydrolase [Pirellulales bacterium]|nr:bifunctional (p)ppGpp synthetase/guanosine-3',5'-bis(diphosphate) 3'-pyrophosphohydrolase [Pirellulales bacterium]
MSDAAGPERRGAVELTSRFTEALAFTCRLHAPQRRKVSGAPYVAHLLRVAGMVLEYAATEDEAIAALLHDAIEDQGGPAARATIRHRFGDEVAALVDECTDTDERPKPPWRERKETFLARLPRASRAARLIVAADKLDNVRSLLRARREHGESIWDHFRGGRDGMLWYFRRVVNALAPLDPSPLVEELARAVGELERIGGE